MLQTQLEIASYLQPLLEVAASLSQRQLGSVEALSQALLAIPPDTQGVRGGRSGLNSDGSPLQVCLTATSSWMQSRLLGDPAFVLADPKERFEHSLQALAYVLEVTGSQPLTALCDRTLQFYVPEDADELVHFTSGLLWLGAGLGTPGCAVYVDARCRGDVQAAWDRAEQWLTAVLPASDEAVAAIAALRPHAYLQSVGIEGSDLSNARAKLYWRFLRPTRIDRLGLKNFQHPALASFLSCVIRDSTLQLTGIVPSLGFAVNTGQVLDAKVDVCAHCLAYTTAEWIKLIDTCTGLYGLKPLPVSQALAHQRSQVSYLGMGCDRSGSLRLNLYLKATAAV